MYRRAVPIGRHVDIELPLPSGEYLSVGGSILYTMALNGGNTMISPGVVIKFDCLTKKNIELSSLWLPNF
jgi:hypothetical protein